MLGSRDKGEDGDLGFSWGTKRKKGCKYREMQFYESFTYDGVEYFLYDFVNLYKEGEHEPYIGKLIRMWENSNEERIFKPSEISYYLGNENVHQKELFLASSEGVGLTNINPLGKSHWFNRGVTALSTSHSSQSNTLEYDLATHWCLHQDRADLWWRKLYKEQERELEKLKESLKLKQ